MRGRGLIFGRVSAKLGPETLLDRRGSSYSAGCDKNEPRRPIQNKFWPALSDGRTGEGVFGSFLMVLVDFRRF